VDETGFVVRPGTETDVPGMLRLWREMMDFHARVEPRFRPGPSPGAEQAWHLHLREHIFGHDEWCVLVAEEDGRLIGQVLGRLVEPAPVFEPGRYGEVTDIVVHPSARRRGVGRALFAKLAAWFRERGADHVELRVAHRNPASQAFWRAMGGTDYMDRLWFDLEAV
jgi:ribosomal protein S18 acetylase RimI-like enzyme